jgi:hypothetical protein
MEYLVGAIASLLCWLAVWRYIQAQAKKFNPRKFRNTQTAAVQLIEPIARKIAGLSPQSLPLTQSSKIFQQESDTRVKVVFFEKLAYWMEPSGFFVANTKDGIIEFSSKRPVDTSQMSSKELDILMEIVEELRR